MENWVDDLPSCKYSGVGFQTNQKYKAGGGRRDIHEREDRSFNVQFPSSNVSLYGVFDGHESAYVAHFAAQKIPAELLLDVEIADSSESVVNLALKNAFDSVEKGYLELINETLVRRTNLMLQIPEGMTSYEVYQKYPNLVHRLQELNKDLQGGVSATIALLQGNNLYVANLGDSRALLCTRDADGSLHVEQLSVDHNLSNAQELQRLANIGLDIEMLQKSGTIDNQETTRSLGDYRVKGGYKDVEFLKPATSEPVISEPFINGKICTDNSFYFLAMFTRGFYKTLQEINGSLQVNRDIIALIAAELKEQSTVEAVAQSVVDKLCRAHQEEFARSNGTRCQEREDMTLLIRLFSASLGRRPTPVTPPIPVSVKHASRKSSRSPQAMPVSVPFVIDSQQQMNFNRLPRLIMPNNRLRSSRVTSLSQPNLRVCSPVTVVQTAATPPCHLFRNLSQVSEGSSVSDTTPSTSSATDTLNNPSSCSTAEMTTLGSATTTLGSSSSSRCASPFSRTVVPAAASPSHAASSDPGLLKVSDKQLPDIGREVLVDAEEEKENTENREQEITHSSETAKQAEENAPPSPDDGKVDPYIDFTEFNKRIMEDGGEKVVFAEFFL